MATSRTLLMLHIDGGSPRPLGRLDGLPGGGRQLPMRPLRAGTRWIGNRDCSSRTEVLHKDPARAYTRVDVDVLHIGGDD
jgi:hypothetical protein